MAPLRIFPLSILTALVYSLLTFGTTPSQAVAAHTPIVTPYDTATKTGDVACTTGGVNTGFFRISNGEVIDNKNCEGAVVVPEGVTSIGYAFDTGYPGPGFGSGFSQYNSLEGTIPTRVTSLTIPSTVTSIGSFAFRGSSITSLTIPNNVTTLGDFAFVGATQLTQLTLGTVLTQISGYAFSGATSLTTLVIPSNVTVIVSRAFEQLTSLTSLTIPNSVTTIGDYAFENATALTSITIPNSVTTIGGNAFRGASNLATLTLGNKVETIGSGAFWGSSSLTSLTIPDSVTSIGFEAFGYSSALTSLTIGSGVTEIPEYAFQYTYELTSLTLGKNLVTIGNNAFQDARKLATLTIPNEVTTIGADAFNGVAALTSLTIPNSVTEVGQNAFNGHSITNLVLCKTLDLTSAGISNSVVRSCNNLAAASAPTITSVALSGISTANISFTAPSNGGAAITRYVATSSPGGLTGFISQAEGGTIAITGLSPGTTYTFTVVARNMIGNSAQSSTSSAITTPNVPGSPIIGTATLTNPTTASVTFTAPSSNGGSTITRYTATASPDGATGIVNQSGSGTITVTGLTPGNTYVFWVTATNGVGTSSLSSESNSVTTPNVPDAPTAVVATRTSDTSVTVTFEAPSNNGGSAITSYTVTSSPGAITGTVSQPGNRSVAITGLTPGTTYSFSVIATNQVGDSVGSGPSNAILGSPYNSLTGDGEVACVNNGAQRGSGYFWIENYVVVESDGCRGSAVIPSGVLEIGDSAFNSSNISALTIPNSVTTIGEYAFYLTSISSLVIPNSVTTIGEGAFEESEFLTSIVIGSGITSISDRAFAYASSLTSLVIGNNVQTIGRFAFRDASLLTSLNLPNSLRTIGISAFRSNNSLTSLIIPDGVTDLGMYSFYSSESLRSVRIPRSVVNIGLGAFDRTEDLETFDYCGNIDWDESFIGVDVTITCTPSQTITIGTTNFSTASATNLGISLANFDQTKSYQVTVKFVNATTNVDVTNGTLSAIRGSTSLISGYTSYSASKLGFKGSFAAITSALSSITWRPATAAANVSIRIGISTAPGVNEFYDANSGHYYRLIATRTPWSDARTTAEATTLFGLQGYLAEVNSAAENAFIANETSASDIWIGAAEDADTAKSPGGFTGFSYTGALGQRWIWNGAALNPLPIGTGEIAQGPNAAYSSWSLNEPNNDRKPGADCAVTNWRGAKGLWNDLPCTNRNPYLIEFGGRAGETSTAVSATLTTEVNAVAPVQYTITYNPNSGNTTPTQASLTTGQTFVLANAITRSNDGSTAYEFAGWSSNSILYKAGETITVATSNLTFTAVWVQLYEVTYVVNGGTFSGIETVNDAECISGSNRCTINQVIELNAAPTRSGYNFAGWKDQSGASIVDSNNAVDGIQTAVTTSNYIFTASWTPITYTVEYVSSGSTAPTQSALRQGQSFTVGAAVTKAGFEFDGWKTGVFTYLPDSQITVGTSNITLTAQWTAVFSVTYSQGLGSGTPLSATAFYPESYELILDSDEGISRSGFTFGGWNDGSAAYQPGDVYTVGTRNITLTAQWTANSVSSPPQAPDPTPASTTSTTPNPILSNNTQPSAQMVKMQTVYMASGSFALSNSTKRSLKTLATQINSSGKKVVLAYGYTDNRGGVNNTRLSQQRAQAVAKFLRPMLKGKTIQIGWFGSKKPVATGNSASDLAINRRVEIWVR
jgi:uncharacterized repeat protein (TIGR02543 family)